MIRDHLSRLQTWLLFLSPVLTLSVKSGYTYINLVLLMLTLWVALKSRGNGSINNLNDQSTWFEVRWVAWAVWFFVAVSLPIDLIYGHSLGALGVFIPFVLMPLTLWLFKSLNPRLEALWLGAAWGAVIGCGVAFYQIIVLDVYRASVHSSAISFGNTGIMLACASMVGYLYKPSLCNVRWWNLQMLLGVAAGVMTSMLSGSKGGWLSLTMVMGIFLFRITVGWTYFKRTIAALFLVIVAAAMLHVPGNPVLSRLVHAYEGLQHWVQTGRDAESDGSVGSRLSMWKFGVSVIDERPVFGFGPQGLAQRWQEEIDAGRADPRWGPKGHLHNELLTVYLWRGAVGLLAMLAVYAIAFKLFWRNRNHHSTDVQGISFMGMMLVLLYLEFGLTDVIWFVNANRQIFLFWLMSLSGLLYVYKKITQKQP